MLAVVYGSRAEHAAAVPAPLPYLHCLLLQEFLPLLQPLIVCVPQDCFCLPQSRGSCVACRCQRVALLPQALQLCSLLRHCALAGLDLIVCEGRVDQPQLHSKQQNRTGVRQAVRQSRQLLLQKDRLPGCSKCRQESRV